MTPAYVNPFMCADVWRAVKLLGPCTTEQVAAKLKISKDAAVKLLGKLVRRGYLTCHKHRGRALMFRLHPNSRCPVDHRQMKGDEPRLPPKPRPAKPFWLGEYWRYSPYGLEARYRIVDTRVPEVRPEFRDAA